MKNKIISLIIAFTGLLLTVQSQAANITMTAGDTGAGNASFAAGFDWPGGLAPTSGNAYFTGPFQLRTYVNTPFAGDSLSVDSGGGTLHVKVAGTTTVTNLILNGGKLMNGIGAVTLAGNITNAGGSTTIDIQGQGRSFTITAPISGSGTITELVGAGGNTASGTVTLNATNTFSGQWVISDAANTVAGALPLLNLGNSNALQNATLSLVTTNKALRFSPGIGGFLLGGLSGNGNIALTNTSGIDIALLVGNNNGTNSYSGNLSDLSGGNLTKTGNGTLTLSGTNTYHGATRISAGILADIVGGSSSNSAVTVAATTGNTAVLGVSIVNNTKQWTYSSLTVNNGGISSGLQFVFGAVTPSTTVAPLNVTGAVSFATAPTIAITGSSLPTSTGNGYPLITWGSGSAPSLAGVTLTLPFRIGGNLAIVGSTLYLQITGSTQPLSWSGGNGTWDINNTGNTIWKDSANNSTYYTDADTVRFNNLGSVGGTVTLNTNVNPIGVTVTNPVADYTISGSGGISGSTTLTKSGAGKLTMTTVNTYNGATTVNAGTLEVSGSGSLAAGSAVTINGGTLAVSGNGSVASSVVNINAGTLALSGSGALATNSVITINGGILAMGSLNATNQLGNNNAPINFGINGGNLNGTGTNSIIGVDGSATAITVAANASAVVNENLFINNTAAAGYEQLATVGSGGTLTINGQLTWPNGGSGLFMSGGGTLVVNNPANSLVGINIWQSGGTISTTNFTALGTYHIMVLGQGGSSPTTFIYTGPAVNTGFQFRTGALNPSVFNNGSGTVTFSNAKFTSNYGNPTSVGNQQTLTLGGSSDITILGNIQDANLNGADGTNLLTGLVKTNANTLTLTGNSTYSGNTTIEAGNLLGVTGGSLLSSNVTVAATTGNTAAAGVSVTDNTLQWTIPILTVNNGGISSGLQFSFGALTPSLTVAPLSVLGDVVLTTVPGITITGSNLGVSTGDGYPLMTWVGSGPTTTNGMTLTLPSGVGGNLAIVGNTLYVQLVSTPAIPQFNPAGGVYYGAQTVTITSTAGSTIHYTTDGSDPTTSGTVVTGASPVTVTVPVNVVNETIKAYASRAGAPANSAVSAQSYNTTLLAAPVSQPMVAGVNDATLRVDFNGTVGYTFTTSTNPIIVTALGYVDGSGLGTNGGLNISHYVALWNNSGTVIGTVTVPAGTAASYSGGYWYATLNQPVGLTPNTTYTIGAQVNAADPWPGSTGTYFPGFSSPLFTGMTALVEGNAVWTVAAYPAPPVNVDTGNSSVWLTCNLQGSTAAAVAVQPVKLGNGSMQFSALGSYGAGYRIWASTNLALTPITSTWSNVSSGTFTGSSVIYTDPAATNYPARFYILTIP